MSSPKTEAAFSRWASGYGRIRHTRVTGARVRALVQRLDRLGIRGDGAAALDVLAAADRVASAAMWLVVHEPGRFRAPRSACEARHAASPGARARLYPDAVATRVFLCHTRPEPMLGALLPLHTGPRTIGLGFTNHGDTLDVGGLTFVNRATWAHCLDAVAAVLALERSALLAPAEIAALDGELSPEQVILGA